MQGRAAGKSSLDEQHVQRQVTGPQREAAGENQEYAPGFLERRITGRELYDGRIDEGGDEEQDSHHRIERQDAAPGDAPQAGPVATRRRLCEQGVQIVAQDGREAGALGLVLIYMSETLGTR